MSVRPRGKKSEGEFPVFLYKYCSLNEVKTIDTLLLVRSWLHFHKIAQALGINLFPSDLSGSVKVRRHQIRMTPEARKILYQWRDGWSTLNPLAALLRTTAKYPNIEAALGCLGTSAEKVENLLEEKRNRNKPSESAPPPRRGGNEDTADRMGGIESFCTDLTELAKAGKIDKVFGREEEVRKVKTILLRRNKPNPLLIGAAGVGKSAIVEGLAQLIVSEDCPKHLKDHRILSVSIGAMNAGTMLRGDFEYRFKEMIAEGLKDKTILFVDELHTIMGAGSSLNNNLDSANMLKPYLARGEIQMIGATTRGEYEQIICKDGALERRFNVVTIEEPTEAETITIVTRVMDDLGTFHGVTVKPEIQARAVRLTNTLVPNRRQPDKTIDLLDCACAAAHGKEEDILSDATFSQSVLDVIGASSPTLRRRYTPAMVEQLTGELESSMPGWSGVVSQFLTGVRKAGRPTPWSDGDSRPAVHLGLGKPDTGRIWFLKRMASALLECDDASLVLDYADFADSAPMSQLNAFLLKQLDGFVIIKGVTAENDQAYKPFCEFLEDGIVNLPHGKRKNGFACSVVVLVDDVETGGLGFTNNSSGSDTIADAYSLLQFGEHLKHLFSMERTTVFGDFSHAKAEDVLKSEWSTVPNKKVRMVSYEHILDECEALTYEAVLSEFRKGYEKAYEEWLEEQDMVTAALKSLDSLGKSA